MSLKNILPVVYLLLLLGCNEPSNQESTSTSTTPANQKSLGSNKITVVDFTGHTVTLDQPAQRIVSLAPHITENVFSAGAGDRLVGVVSYSDYPPAALEIPLVGGYHQFSEEKIIELQPDLVIAWLSGNSAETADRLKQLGFTVYIDQPDSLFDVGKSIRDIGTLAGTSQQADPTVKRYLTDLESIAQSYRDSEKVTTFYQVWHQPLQTISGNHIISNAIEICGGTNIYADEPTIAPVINIESILQRNPQAIIASGMSSARPDWLEDWKKWPSLQAVEKNNLFFVDPNYIQRHTIRLLKGVKSVCQQLDDARQLERN